jgi:hypothetical protein
MMSETARTTAGALVHEPDTLGARSLSVRAGSGHCLAGHNSVHGVQ